MSVKELSQKSKEIRAQKKIFVENLHAAQESLEQHKKQNNQQISFQNETEKKEISNKIKRYETLISECDKLIKAIDNLKKKPEARHNEIDIMIEKSNIYTDFDLPPSTRLEAVTRLDPVKEGLPDDASLKKKILYTAAQVISSIETTRGLRGSNTQIDKSGLTSSSGYRDLTTNPKTNLPPNQENIKSYPSTKQLKKSSIQNKNSDIENNTHNLQRELEEIPGCKVTIGFLGDVSGTMQKDMPEVIKAISEMTDFFMKYDGSKISIAQFANSLQRFSTLGSTDSAIPAKVKEAVNKVYYRGGGTNLGAALQKMYDEAIVAVNARTNPEEVIDLVALTDAVADDEPLALEYAKKISELPNVRLIVFVYKNAANLADSNNKEFLGKLTPNLTFFPDVQSLKNIVSEAIKTVCRAKTASPVAATPQPTTAATRQMTTATTTPQPTAAGTTANPTAAPTFAPELWWTLFLPFIFRREAIENAQLLEEDLDQQDSVESQEALNVLNEITVDAPGDIKNALNNLISSKLAKQADDAKADPQYWDKKNMLLARSKKWKKEDGKWIYDGWKKTESGDWKKDGSALTKTNVDYQKLVLEDLGRMGIYATDFKGDIPPNDEDITPEAPPSAPPRREVPPGPGKKEYYIPKQFRATWAPIPIPSENLLPLSWAAEKVATTVLPIYAIPYLTAQALALSKISTWLKEHPEKYSLAMSRLYPTLFNKVVPEKAADVVKNILESLAPGRVVSEDEFKKVIEELKTAGVNIDIDRINAGTRKKR